MTEQRLQQILHRFPEQKVLIVGDFFLDHYLIIDRALSETSLETGLEAYQVVQIRNSPGAGGTVANNLRALEVQHMPSLSSGRTVSATTCYTNCACAA